MILLNSFDKMSTTWCWIGFVYSQIQLHALLDIGTCGNVTLENRGSLNKSKISRPGRIDSSHLYRTEPFGQWVIQKNQIVQWSTWLERPRNDTKPARPPFTDSLEWRRLNAQLRERSSCSFVKILLQTTKLECFWLLFLNYHFEITFFDQTLHRFHRRYQNKGFKLQLSW